MNKETIEKAVIDYIGFERDISEDIDTWIRRKAFKAGAEWRINSVWHESTEVPEENKELLVKIIGDRGKPEMWIERYDKEYLGLENSGLSWDEVILWAYIEDLLPSEKGGLE